MLLYIDKKKQKRHQIKIISLILCGFLILISNLISYPKFLHNSASKLTTYASPSEYPHTQSNALTIFSASQYASPNIILLPNTINREEAITLAQILYKYQADIQNIFMSIPNKEFIFALAKQIIPTVKETDKTENTVILTTDYTPFQTQIQKQKLYPYTRIQSSKITLSPNVQKLIDEKFPLPPKPHNQLEAEQKRLTDFIQNYEPAVKKLFHPDTEIDSPDRYLLLQNANICIETDKNQYCQLDETLSLARKIRILRANIPQNLPKIKLHFLTSFEEISYQDKTNKNDGLLFRFENREAILLPNSGKMKNSLKELKIKAGINPLYHNNKMKLYKFKTKELEIDDEI